MRFRILSDAEEKKLRTVERPSPKSRLLLGLLFFRSGMVAEAEEQFAQLARDNPESRPVQRLIHMVREFAH